MPKYVAMVLNSKFPLFAALLFIAAVFSFQQYKKKNTVYLYPGFFSLENTNGKDVFLYGENLSEICRQKSLDLKIVRSIDKSCLKNMYKLIIFDLENISRKNLKKMPAKRLVLFLWEPPSTVPKNYQKKYHRFFAKIYTWNDSLVDNRKYFKFYYPEKKEPVVNSKPFAQKKILAMMARYKHSKHPDALYRQREQAVEILDKKPGFSLFGPAWSRKYQSYKGEAPSKKVLQHFKFCLCYENMQNIKGYVTEKIFDAFYFGCVPIYLGAANIEQYIPANCFIDRRRFSSLQEVYGYLEKMDERTYAAYLENINRFLQSSQAQVFTPENFSEIFEQAVFK